MQQIIVQCLERKKIINHHWCHSRKNNLLQLNIIGDFFASANNSDLQIFMPMSQIKRNAKILPAFLFGSHLFSLKWSNASFFQK